MAVLYRAHFHSMEIQMEMTREGIPFQITSGLRFFEQAHVKDVGAFLKFVVNPRDEVAFKRMVKLLPGIGARSAEQLWEAVLPLAQRAVQERGTSGGVSLGGEMGRLKVPTKAAAAWKQLGHTIEELLPGGAPVAPLQMLRSVREAVYDDYARAKFPDFDNRREDLDTLAQFAAQYRSAEEFVDQMALMGGATEPEGTGGGSGEEESVTLSSVHQAKGLEWKVVFVVWLTEGMFPSQRSMGSAEALEEERRLFYVAVTRAEEDLYLSWPLVRRNAGAADVFQRVSPFLRGLPAERTEEWQVSGVW
jgi:DNA helicase-2/ATP-dependent DNA helicase PcrA